MSADDRVLALDWLRGLGVLIMLQGHLFNSFARADLHNHPVYVLSQFIGGMPAPIFLFLVGVTLAFRLDRADRQGSPPAARLKSALRRAGFLAAIAFAFRLQLWIFAWGNPWTEIVRVDILNCMAFGIAVISPIALLPAARRITWFAGAGLAIAALAPLISMLDWSGVPWLLRNYLVPNKAFFSFFPDASYIAFGAGFGGLLRMAPASRDRVMQWAAVFGVALVVTAHYFSNLPFSLYPSSDFWLNSPGLIFIRLGIVMALAAAGFVWTASQQPARLAFMRRLGTNSLLIYWVHVELVYGRWFWFAKEHLTIGACAAASLLLIALMSWLATLNLPARVKRRLRRLKPAALVPETT
ncbi:MAG TPA: heparan-alpha-glucosaminide N-acetyltransferase domain-containing protein [Bryobacteraceae bacterium]|nr:heparan-alpha-glucosaminide N-acetyltransferase domain-containing protein [Bryobacteraceae bacterium]